MQTSVELQGPFYYSTLILVILLTIVLVPAIIWLIHIIKGVKLPTFKKKVKVVPPKPVVIDKERLRRECFARIGSIETQEKNKEITRRKAYILLSETVRKFISRVSGNNASALTLKEIKELDNPSLANLIEQFYHPEFAFDDATEEEMDKAFFDARKVVKEWN